MLLSGQLAPAFGLGAVDAERVERRELVHELVLRRDRDHDVVGGEQDRLAQLAVPVAEGHRLALEDAELELGAEDVVARAPPDRSSRSRVAASPTRAQRHPGVVVLGAHRPARLLLEAGLQLGAAPGLHAPDARWSGVEPGRAGDRARVPGVVGQVGGEDLALVGGDHHVVVGRALGEDRHLRLDLDVAGVGAAGAAGVLVDPGLDDARAELLRRAAVGVGEQPCPRGASPRSGTSRSSA